jgi:hypothetical protein
MMEIKKTKKCSKGLDKSGHIEGLIMNRLYTFVFYLLTHGEPDRGMPLPHHWSPPHIEASMAAMWPEGRDSASDATNV